VYFECTLVSQTHIVTNVSELTEVTSTWLRPQDIPQSFGAAVDNETGFLRHDAVVGKRLFKRGVHHPKFMILIQESGSIVVVVSTANLTPAVTTDASWVQRFPAATTTRPTGQSAQYRATDSNDFGPVLANFLQCQMLSTAAEQITTHWFVKKYLGWNSVVDLERVFDFSKAQAKLVPTVPGDYQVNDATNVTGPTTTARKLLYGQERVADCLKHVSLPPSLLTDQDRLIFQPTSFGGDWNQRNMAYLVRSYLGEQQNSEMRDRTLLERLDIVWPTDHFVREASRNPAGRSTPLAIAERSNGFNMNGRSKNLDTTTEADRMEQACLFLSSETFNKIDLTCLNRMVMFEPSNPPQQPVVLSPHFKSVARLFHGSDYRIRRDYGASKCEEYFSWFLLTSACLSRGAQGEALVETSASSEGTTVAYSNFELGVLLCSHLAGSRGSSRSNMNRIYCWKPSQCSCASTSTTLRLIHLPIPYSVRPARYVEDEDEAILCETPYFHEIPPGTGCVGNMLLTPYGTALAAKYNKQARFL
jgi:Tyrosyl-DNA phosphodiesterase